MSDRDYIQGIDFARHVLDEQGILLTDLDRAAIEAAWKDVTYSRVCEEQGLNVNTIQNCTAPNLWKKLGKILGRRVTKKTFREIVISETKKGRGLGVINESSQDSTRETSVLKISPKDGFANIEGFIGREKEINDLFTLVQKYQFTLLLGMEGVGKKSLVSKMLQLKREQLSSEHIVWRSLHYNPTIAQLQSAILDNETEKSISLIDYMKRHKVLLVLDSLDSIFSKGQDEERIEEYVSFLRRAIEETPSVVVGISSRPIERLEYFILRDQGMFYRLKGLSVDDASLLLQNSWTQAQIEEICEAVEGNPLLLKKIAGNADYIDSTVIDRLTIQYGLVGSHYERILRQANLSAQDKLLLSDLSKQSRGLSLAEILAKYPSATMKIKQLVDMGIAHRVEDQTIAMTPLFKQATTVLGF